MSDLSFHLVDRIVDLEPERSARGRLAVPAALDAFPACLVVEAIGQLAAWVAMQRSGFERRPVAARADDVRVFGSVRPGDVLHLAIRVQSCKSIAIAYEGEGIVDGRTLVELRGAVGAMLPMSEFEAPEKARARFDALLDQGLPPRDFPGRAAFAPRVLSRKVEGERVEAELEAAPPGPLYADHFARRPVYPATLLLDAQLRLALDLEPALAAEAAHDVPAGSRLLKVKVRSFTPPGGRVTAVAERRAGAREIDLEAHADGKRVSSATLVPPPGV
ncbi:MAG: hypothetical protein ACKO2K_18315 [Alphaproteobacteria bacterium]